MTPRNILLSSVALIAFTSLAFASDLPSKKAPAVAPLLTAYDWTGFYTGANFGVGMTGSNVLAGSGFNTQGTNQVDLTNTGVTGGVQAGYNWQLSPHFVLGLEADVGYLGARRALVDWDDSKFLPTTRSDFFGTIRPRIGYASGRGLLFVTGGLAMVNVRNSFGDVGDIAVPTITSTKVRTGWALGGGLETALSGNWTAKAEYLYIDAGKSTLTNPARLSDVFQFRNRYQIGRIGLNYRFGDSTHMASSPEPTRDWSGFYVGLNSGIAANSSTATGSPGVGGGQADIYSSGFTGGVQAGYNFQYARNLLLGVEADAGYLGGHRQFCEFNDCNALTETYLGARNSFLSTGRVRAGYAWDQSLAYATAGVAMMNTRNSFSSFGSPISSLSAHNFGWTVGAGLETALSDNWSVKTEYLHVATGRRTITIPTDTTRIATFENSANIFRIGLNYKFGGPSGAIVQKY